MFVINILVFTTHSQLNVNQDIILISHWQGVDKLPFWFHWILSSIKPFDLFPQNKHLLYSAWFVCVCLLVLHQSLCVFISYHSLLLFVCVVVSHHSLFGYISHDSLCVCAFGLKASVWASMLRCTGIFFEICGDCALFRARLHYS